MGSAPSQPSSSAPSNHQTNILSIAPFPHNNGHNHSNNNNSNHNNNNKNVSVKNNNRNDQSQGSSQTKNEGTSRNTLKLRTGDDSSFADDDLPVAPAAAQTFDMVTLEDGTCLTTYFDEETGSVYYIDWATMTWQLLPDEYHVLVAQAADPMLAANDHVRPASSWRDQGNGKLKMNNNHQHHDQNNKNYRNSNNNNNHLQNIQAHGHRVNDKMGTMRDLDDSFRTELDSIAEDEVSFLSSSATTVHVGLRREPTSVRNIYGSAQSDRAGTYRHPKLGEISTYVYDTKSAVLNYFQPESGAWLPLPLSWEARIPETRALLGQISAVLPDWNSSEEMILALRLHQYDVERTVLWKTDEMKYGGMLSTKAIRSSNPHTGASEHSQGKQDHAICQKELASLQNELNALKISYTELEQLYKSSLAALSEVKGENVKLSKQLKMTSFGLERQSTRIDTRVEQLTTENNKYKFLNLQLQESLIRKSQEIDYLKSHGMQSSLLASVTHATLGAPNKDISLQTSRHFRSDKVNNNSHNSNSSSREIVSGQNDEDTNGSIQKNVLVATKSRSDNEGDEEDLSSSNLAAMAQRHKEELGLHATKLKELDASVAELNDKNQKLKIQLRESLRFQLKGYSEVRSLFDTFREEVEGMLAAFLSEFGTLVQHSLRFKDAFSGLRGQLEEAKAKYRAEMIHRKLLFNQVQEIRGNIRVFCRCRKDDTGPSFLNFPSPREVIVTEGSAPSKAFDYDAVFSPQSSQDDVFAEARAFLVSVVDGYNVSLISYGQTGAGKTYTMMGSMENPGVNRRAVRELLASSKTRPELSFAFSVSILEIYNEQIVDLLSNSDGDPKKCSIQNTGSVNGRNVGGLTEVVIGGEEDVMSLIERAEKNRSVAATKMNSSSSRSHLVITVYVMSKNSISGAVTHSKLTLVDLAGSERVSKTEATGLRLVEAAAINKSLTTLGQVFSSLRQNALHVPYRNSKLTHLLQDSLGGDAKALVFVHISPLASNLAETLSTLHFGKGIKYVKK